MGSGVWRRVSAVWRRGGRLEGLPSAHKFPPSSIFRIAHWCSKHPNWLFTCVTGGFLMSNVNSDIKYSVRTRYLQVSTYRCKNLGRRVQPVPLGQGSDLTPQHFGGSSHCFSIFQGPVLTLRIL